MTKPKPKQQPEQQPNEVYKPMAVPELTTDDRLDAMVAEIKAMKDWINKHSRSHTGRDAL